MDPRQPEEKPDMKWLEDLKQPYNDLNGTGQMTLGYAIVCIIIGSFVAWMVWGYYL